MQSVAEELRTKTMVYWKLSRIWNGHVDAPVSIADGVELCSTILEQTSYTRPIYHVVDGLLQEIITHEPKKFKSKVLEIRNGSQG